MSSLSPVLLVLGWAVVHALWQGALLGSMLGRLRRLDPREDGRRAAVALGVFVALFVATAWVVGSGATPVGVAGGGAVAASAPVVAALPIVGLVWTIGAGALVLRTLVGAALGVCVMRRGRRPLGASIEREFVALARRMGVRQVTLAGSARIDSPLVVGVLRPCVLVPVSAVVKLSREELHMLLAHELAHVSRRDGLRSLAVELVADALFFHPIVWRMRAALEREREFACDDRVVELLGGARAYARALERAESARLPWPALAQAAARGVLVERVRRLVAGGGRVPSGRGALHMVVAGLLVLGVTHGVAPRVAFAAPPGSEVVDAGSSARLEPPAAEDARPPRRTRLFVTAPTSPTRPSGRTAPSGFTRGWR